MKTSKNPSHDEAIDSQRLDIWLWASRFYKTRKIASDAIKGGHISVNGKRSKPARTIKTGDQIKIKRYPVEYTVIVHRVSDKRLGAALAAELYCETEQSQFDRETKLQQLKDQREGLRYDRKRPGKRDRQKMLKVKNQIPDLD